jgi:vacuolar iron transporter family protein
MAIRRKSGPYLRLQRQPYSEHQLWKLSAYSAVAVSADPDTALRVHTRNELGVDPFELPSGQLAGISSLIASSAGAVLPLLPHLVGFPRLAASLGVAAVALAAGVVAVGRMTGRPLLFPVCASSPWARSL